VGRGEPCAMEVKGRGSAEEKGVLSAHEVVGDTALLDQERVCALVSGAQFECPEIRGSNWPSWALA